MSLNNTNQAAGAQASAGTTARDFGTQDNGTTQETPKHSRKEQELADQGKMPGLAEVQKDTHVRQSGEEDAAGNKIHHKGLLGHILHWEHSGMNADN